MPLQRAFIKKQGTARILLHLVLPLPQFPAQCCTAVMSHAEVHLLALQQHRARLVCFLLDNFLLVLVECDQLSTHCFLACVPDSKVACEKRPLCPQPGASMGNPLRKGQFMQVTILPNDRFCKTPAESVFPCLMLHMGCRASSYG